MSQPTSPIVGENDAKQRDMTKNTTTKLPEELWRQVFWEASATLGVDEFSLDPVFHFNKFGLEDMGTSFLTREQLRVTLQCRLNIVLVCRAFADAGMSILWSHLRLKFRNPTKILDILQQRPELGQYVRRFSPVEEGPNFYNHISSDYSSVLHSILNFCPQVHTLELSLHISGLLDIPPSSQHLHLHLTGIDKTFPAQVHSVTSLRLSIGNTHWMEPLKPMEFPALLSLDIQGVANENWINGITNNWSLPVLKMLALPPGDGTMGTKIMQLLQKYSATVTVLQIPKITFAAWNGNPLLVPQLAHLYIAHYVETLRCLQRFPIFSNLQTVSVYWGYGAWVPLDQIIKNLVTGRTCLLLDDLCSWTPPRTTIRLLGRPEFHDWAFSQPQVLRSIDGIWRSGRRVERLTADGEIEEIRPIIQ